MGIARYLQQPYSLMENRWKTDIIISVFIALFLYVFQPFGLHYIPSNKLLYIGGYGLVTFFVLFGFDMIIPKMFPKIRNENSWTIIKQILYLCCIVVSISIGNYIYTMWIFDFFEVGIREFFLFAGYTLSIGLLPIIGATIISHNQMLKKNLAASSEINQSLVNISAKKQAPSDKVNITSENQKQAINTDAASIVCIEAVGNYVNICYLKKFEFTSLLIRNTLKNVEKQLGKKSSLFKCHRAFIINLFYVDHVKGNSQGYRLILKYMDEEIPVSRNYTKKFKEKILQQK